MGILVHLLSDLHLNVSQMRPHPAAAAADIILAPGDIWGKTNGISMLRVMYPDQIVVTVPGNHESYRTDINENIKNLRIAAEAADVHLLENNEAIFDIKGEKVRILGCTLWTNFELYGEDKKRECMLEAGSRLNDFRLIQNGKWNFSPQDSINLHNTSVKWLKSKLNEHFDGATIVATHHAPSYQSVVERYKDDLLSACFASNLDELMDGSSVELWVHGHMHSSLDYSINGTRVMCNPRGYTRYKGGEENEHFDPALVIEVKKGLVNIIPKSNLPTAYTDESKPQLSARQRDDAIWAIDKLQVRGLGSGMGSNYIEYVDIWELKPELRHFVREIVLAHSLQEYDLEGHNAVLPVMVACLEYLIKEIIKQAPETKRKPRRIPKL